MRRRLLLATPALLAAAPSPAPRLAAAWGGFRQRFLTVEGRVVDTGNRHISHSEGQGWAMLAAARAGDEDGFRRLWDWTQRHLRRAGDSLLAWRFRPDQTPPVDDPNNATDGDLFIAWALLEGAARWNEPLWAQQAEAIARDVLRLLVRPAGPFLVLLPGARGFEHAGFTVVNPSYYAFPAIRALGVAERILAVQPDNAEALSIAAEAAAQLNRPAQASEYLARLRRVVPAGDPRLNQAQASLSVTNEGAETLAEARRLAQSGRPAEAVQRYRQLFRGSQPPPFLLREFLDTLAGTGEAGHREAVAELRRAFQAAPNDTQLALTLGALLTRREETRDEGIEILRRLARNPATATSARQELRQVYLWEPGSPVLVRRIEELQSQLGSLDAELQAKLEEARVTERASRRLEAWELMEQRRPGEAERRFRDLVAQNPNDPEALMGLATVLGVQGRYAEMRDLRARAIALAPDRESEFRAATERLDAAANLPRGGRGGAGGPAVLPASALAWRALERGRLDEADRFARRAVRGRGDEAAQGELVLGQVATQRDDHAEAERRFRNALAQRPADQSAALGLYFALVNQNRNAEAEEVRARYNLAAVPGAGIRRGFQLREQAARSNSDENAIGLLREALRQDPSNVYARLDLARRLRRAGDPEQARLIEAQLAQSGTPDGLGMAALLATDEERFGDAAAYLSRVPPQSRTGEQNLALAQARAESTVRQLEGMARMGDPGARARMMAIAARPDPSGAAAAQVVAAFGRLNDRAAAVQAAQAGLRANPRLSGAGQLAIASALAEAQAVAESLQVVASAERGNLSAEDRRQATFLREFAAVQRADRRTAAGDVVGAWEELAPHLRGPAASPQVSTALMRAYVRARRYDEARQVAEALLARDPLDPAIRASAVDLAVEMREYGWAEALLVEGRRFDVSSVELLLAEARLARARQNPVRELRALEAAGRVRMSELRVGGQAQQAAVAAEYLAPNRAGLRPAADLSDPVTAQVVREMSRARDEAATWIQAGVGVTTRSGQAGLTRSTTVTAPFEVSTPVPGAQGRVSLLANMVHMVPGSISNNTTSLQQFGTNPLAFGRAPSRPDSSATGAELNLAYRGQYVRADIGSTPIGFRRTNVVGGVEVLLPLHERVALRLTGERRGVTDTLLAYGGLRDQLTGTTFGAVTRNGGRAQLELSLTPTVGAYVGGGAYALEGRNVASNTMFEVGGGVYKALRNTPAESLTVGVDARYTSFDRNLAFSTLGHGGYFSPQRFTSLSLVGDWRRQIDDWTLRAQASIGWQWIYSSGAPVFPTRPDDQALVSQLAAADPNVIGFYPSSRSSGIGGGLALNAEYAISPDWRIGGLASFQKNAGFENFNALFYLRYRINPAAADTAPLLAGAPRLAPQGSYPFAGSFGQGRPEPVSTSLNSTRPTW